MIWHVFGKKLAGIWQDLASIWQDLASNWQVYSEIWQGLLSVIKLSIYKQNFGSYDCHLKSESKDLEQARDQKQPIMQKGSSSY